MVSEFSKMKQHLPYWSCDVNILFYLNGGFNQSIQIELIRESISSISVGKSVGFDSINNETIIYSRFENLLKF